MNFAPVSVSSESFEAYVSPYLDKENFNSLREKYPECVFHRKGSQVFCIPFKQSAQTTGEKSILSVKGNLDIAGRLMREALVRRYADLGFQFTKLRPIRFVVSSKNLVETVSDSVAKIVVMSPEYEIDIRAIYGRNSAATMGLTVGVSIRAEIIKSVKELEGTIPTKGMYVVYRLSKKLGQGSVSWNELQGRVESVSGECVRLADYRSSEHVSAKDCYPEGNKRNRKAVLDALLGNKANRVALELDKATLSVLGGDGKLVMIQNVFDDLSKASPISCCIDLSFAVSQQPLSGNSIDSRRVNVPTFVFDPAKNKTSHWHDNGLNEHGPFDSESFPKKEPKIVVVVPDRFKGETEVFINTFRNGVPNHSRFEKGFVRKYHLNKLGKLEFAIVDSGATLVEGYRDACFSCLEKDTYDLAVVIIEDWFHNLFGNDNPYLVTKSIFMSQGIPVQELEIESVRGPGKPFTMNNLGLACYAKLGGIPWTISSLYPVAHELVIGLGSAIVREGRLTEPKRYLGITTVFDADGNYLLSNISREVEIEGYQEELIKSLQQTLDEVSKRNAWQKEDTVRLIFHQTFKEFRHVEVEAVKNFVSSIVDFNVEFAFVHVGHDHPLVIFDRNEQGLSDAKFDRITKGKLVPERGYLIQIGDRQALLTVTGPKQLRTPFQGCPKPLMISIHRDSSFKDISYLTRQVYEFTFLSWRAFNPTSTPVTILYSDLIARLLGQLRHVKNWNPDILRTKLRYSRWFV
jgi:hypothetical protein